MVDCEKSSNFARMNLQMFRYITLSVVLMAALMLLSACSNSDDAPATAAPAETAPQEVLFNANVHRMLDGTRANTIDSNTLLQGQDLKIDAYFHGTNTAYLDSKHLKYDTDHWRFDNGSGTELHYYWPIEGSVYDPSSANITVSSLDFVGSCPFTTPGYVTPTYSHSTGLSFTCNMSSYMTNTDQASMPEYLVAIAADKTYADQGVSGVPLVFKHPFALVKFVITEGSGTHVQVNSVSIPALYTGATCTYNGSTMSWGSYDEESKAAMTVTQTLKIGGTTQSTPFVVIPKNYGSKALTVNCTWDDWSAVTKDLSANVSFDWQPGYIYTYNLTVTKYALKVETEETFTEQW